MLKKKWLIIGGTTLLLIIVIVIAIIAIEGKTDVTASKSEEQVEQKNELDNKETNEIDKVDDKDKQDELKNEPTIETDNSNPTEKHSAENPTTETVEKKTESNTSNDNTSNKEENKSKNTTTTKTTTVTESIQFETVRQNDSSLEKGKEVVAQNGQNGVRTITYKETYVDGKLTNKVQVPSTVTKNPVNKIVKVGTKESSPKPAPENSKMLSASQAKSILNQNGNFKKSANGNEFYYLDDSNTQAIRVVVGSNHVTRIYWNNIPYVSMEGTKDELIAILGEELGTHEYEYGQRVRREIESTVRSAANAVYGSGTAKANQLYSQILNSGSRTFGF